KYKFDAVAGCLDEVKKELAEAHKIQTYLIQREAKGEKHEINILLVHAQDHLMSAILSRDLAEEMIALYKSQAQMIKDLEDLKKHEVFKSK
ncbi:MAG: PTS lactose/cellobiose transporter subunit IIA, partial [Oligoflexales bacterium]|nr:PTS lactose/cellobiose transporter subunit IIA [Oligoflexales bacterium]